MSKMLTRECAWCMKLFKVHENATRTTLCPECTELREKTMELEDPHMLGYQYCWKTGYEMEITTCMERKQVAIKRDKDGKDYDMDYCLLCGTHPDTTATKVPEMILPPDEVRRTDDKPCEICGDMMINPHIMKRICHKCMMKRTKESNKKRYDTNMEGKRKGTKRNRK